MHNFVLINRISFLELSLIGFSFDSIDRVMDLIVLICLKLDTLLLIEVVNIFTKHRPFLVFQFQTQSMFRFEIGYSLYDMVGNNG
jgi:hypothetical protein